MSQIKTVEIQIPIRGSGNIIREQLARFTVYEHQDGYRAVPVMEESERMVADLPPELIFTVKDGQVISSRGKMEGNLNVLKALLEALHTT